VRNRLRGNGPWGPVAVALAVVLVGVPLYRLVDVVANAGTTSLRQLVTGAGFASALTHSVVTAAAATAIAVPLGTVMALVTCRATVPGRRWLQGALVLPLLVPQFALGYSWTQAYGRSGFTDTLFGVTWAGLLGGFGVVVVMAVTLLPLVFVIVAVSLRTRAEPDLERAARASGAGHLVVARTITLPLLRGPLAAATALVFVAGLEAFGVPAALGMPAGYDTLTTRIYRDLALASEPSAFNEAVTLALLLVVLAMCVLVPVDQLMRRRALPLRSGAGGSTPQSGRPTAGAHVGSVLLWLYVVAVVGLPLLAVGLASVTPAVGVSPAPRNWTLANYRVALAGPTLGALRRSLLLAVAAGTLIVLLGFAVAMLERQQGSAGLGTLVTLGYALPGSAVAVGVYLAYGRWLRDTLLIMLLAYVTKLWPLGHRPVAAVADRLHRDEPRAARASGAGSVVSWRTVQLPRLAPALVAAWFLVFLTVLHELTMSSLLYGPRTQTLAVVVLNAQEVGGVGVTAALSVLLTALVPLVAAPAVVWWLIRRRHPRSARVAPVESVLAHAA
jgi:iron(III) transport system permease protein